MVKAGLDSLEVAGRAYVDLGHPLLLVFGLLVMTGQDTVAQHVVDVVQLLVAAGNCGSRRWQEHNANMQVEVTFAVVKISEVT